jgi:hypothetical protein
MRRLHPVGIALALSASPAAAQRYETSRPSAEPLVVPGGVLDRRPEAVWRAPRALREFEGNLQGSVGFESRVLGRGAPLAVWLGAAYQPLGFNLRPVLEPSIRLVAGTGALTFSTQARYGQSLVDTERYGSLRIEALANVATGLALGVEAAGTFDLEIDADEPLGEPETDLRSGPLLVLTRGPVRVVASGGAQRLALRFSEPRLGAVALLGVGVGL